jgi:acetylornithine deacetylase|tara:strand:+ start:21 stop:1142 length:1122 start_codon:yes stop_codon:yes gene_type:complete
MQFNELFSRIIACNSISSVDPAIDQGNRPLVDLLANQLQDMGFECEVMALSANKANLIATRGRGPGGLVLAGHTDTVPCDESLWNSDPFALTERDNAWYGLGCCDMKSFFALAIEALRGYSEDTFKQPLIILATADEESSMSGAKALVDAGRPLARRALIGEPTGMQPVSMHKGIMIEKLTITGASGHSSNPQLGRNAMETMQRILAHLLALRERMREHKHPGFTIDYPTLNLGCIRGGDNTNRICGHCFLAFEIRPLPGMDIDQLQRDLERGIASLAEADRVDWQLERLIVPPFCAQPDSQMLALCEKLTGHSAGSVAFATEAPYLQQLGMDVVVLGPGDIDVAHQPNEYLDLERIDPSVAFLSQLIGHCCL